MLATATTMKPRPAGCKAAAKGKGLVGPACGGWAWRPRPRARSARLSPKCSHSTSAVAAGAVQSESEHHHRHRVREVLSRPVRLAAGTAYGSELEERVEKFIYACRFMTFLAIAGSLLGSIPCFLKGCVYIMDAFIEYYLHGGLKVTLMLVEAIAAEEDVAATSPLFNLNILPTSSFDLNMHPDGAFDMDHSGIENEPLLDDSDNALYADHIAVQFDEEELDDSSDEEDDEEGNQPPPNINGNIRKYLTDSERQQVYEAVLWRSNNGKVKRNTTTIVAALFNVNRSYVQSICIEAQQYFV